MELKVINQQGQAVESLQAAETLFGREYNEALVHQVVTAYLANARAGNRAQKDRSEINKSTKKPFRQKVRVVLAPVVLPARCGVGVARFSRTARMKTSATR